MIERCLHYRLNGIADMYAIPDKEWSRIVFVFPGKTENRNKSCRKRSFIRHYHLHYHPIFAKIAATDTSHYQSTRGKTRSDLREKTKIGETQKALFHLSPKTCTSYTFSTSVVVVCACTRCARPPNYAQLMVWVWQEHTKAKN